MSTGNIQHPRLAELRRLDVRCWMLDVGCSPAALVLVFYLFSALGVLAARPAPRGPLVLLEAMSFGIPLAVSDTLGNRELRLVCCTRWLRRDRSEGEAGQDLPPAGWP